FYSAKTRMENILVKFPELSNIEPLIISQVCEEAKVYQSKALHVLLDLQQSYRQCWILQVTKRTAQMLLKFESISIIQLYETGMLEENEYTHILELIQKKLFVLEYETIRSPKKEFFPLISFSQSSYKLVFDLLLFQSLSDNDRLELQRLLENKREWFQPNQTLLRRNQFVINAYIIIRGIVESKHNRQTIIYYKLGNIIGIESLYTKQRLCSDSYQASALVEVYQLNNDLLTFLLDKNERIKRIIYDEIALHILINNYERFQLTINYYQLKTLLGRANMIVNNEEETKSIKLKQNQRLFLVTGLLNVQYDDPNTMARRSEPLPRRQKTQPPHFYQQQRSVTESRKIKDHIIVLEERNLNAPHLIEPTLLNVIYKLQPTSIAYIWSLDDELTVSTIPPFQLNFQTQSTEDVNLETLKSAYPHYSGDTVEFTAKRDSIHVTRPIMHSNHIQMIPAEIENSL
ncbi:unnamed protein product, partial [Didymodactylos carnosus]